MSMNVMIIAFAVAMIVGDITALWWFAKRFGAFTPVKPGMETVDPVWIAYNTHSGPYQLIGPVCDGVYSALRDDFGFTPELGFGLYFDNPRKVDKDQLRSIGGCLVPADKAAGLADKTLPFRMAALPGGRAMVARFPFHGRVSIVIGAMRVYPALNRQFTEAGVSEGPIMEVYDMTAREIRYIRPLDIPNGELERLL